MDRTPDFGSVAAIPQIKKLPTPLSLAAKLPDEAKELLSSKVKDDVPRTATPGRSCAAAIVLAILQGDRATGCDGYNRLSLGRNRANRQHDRRRCGRTPSLCEDAPNIDWAADVAPHQEPSQGRCWCVDGLRDHRRRRQAFVNCTRKTSTAFIGLTRSAANWPRATRSVLAGPTSAPARPGRHRSCRRSTAWVLPCSCAPTALI